MSQLYQQCPSVTESMSFVSHSTYLCAHIALYAYSWLNDVLLNTHSICDKPLAYNGCAIKYTANSFFFRYYKASITNFHCHFLLKPNKGHMLLKKCSCKLQLKNLKNTKESCRG